MSRQFGLFPEYDEEIDISTSIDYKAEIISILELLLESGEVSLFHDDISDSHIVSLIKYLRNDIE